MKIEQRKDLLGNKVYTLKMYVHYQVVFDMDVSLDSILNYLYNYHFKLCDR